jgi:O-antigen/teichoic acid export membrane protein
MSSTATHDLVARPPAIRGVLGLARRRVRELTASPLLQKSGLAVFEQAVVSGTSFATSVLLGRCAPREELGIYYLALSIVFFARGIQEQLVCAPYMIYCGRKQGAALAEYTGSALLHQCGIALVTVAGLIVMLLAGLAPRGAEAAFWFLVAAAPLLLMREFIRHVSFAHLNLNGAIALNIATSFIQLVALSTLAWTDRLSVSTTIAVLAISTGVPAIVWLAMKRQPMVGRLRAAVRDLTYNWPFARWALASHLLACSTPFVMPWVVAFTHGEAETGMLGACSTLVGLSNTFLMGLCNFLSPRAARAFAEGGLTELRLVLKHTALLFASTLGAFAIIALVAGDQIAVFVYGPQFAGAGSIIAVLSLSVLANSFGVTAGNGLWAMERPSANFVADLFALVIVIAATLAFVPIWGPLGAALATLCGTSSDAAVRLWILRQTMRDWSAGQANAVAMEAA